MASLITTDGTTSEVCPADHGRFTKEEIRILLGGNFRKEAESSRGVSVLVQQGPNLKMNKEAMKRLKMNQAFGNVLVVSHDEYDPGEE